MGSIDNQWVRAELATIRSERNPSRKGRLLEALVRRIFCEIPGLSIEDQDVINEFGTQEMDLFFWNTREREGFHFLDCPLIIECKGWSKKVSGRELRQFATLLRDRGRQNGIFVALHGVTGNPQAATAGFYHSTIALAGGQLVLVLTGEDLINACDPANLVALLQRRMLDLVKGQVLRIGAASERSRRRRSRERPGTRERDAYPSD